MKQTTTNRAAIDVAVKVVMDGPECRALAARLGIERVTRADVRAWVAAQVAEARLNLMLREVRHA